MMKKQMKTHFLMYRVCGKECPRGMTAEKCNLRKTFQDWQKKGKSLFDYHVLSNGVLVVSGWLWLDGSIETAFDIDKVMAHDCDTCEMENGEKGAINPNENFSPMYTVVYATEFDYEKCPEGMTAEKCPLRKKFTELQKDQSIGYVELDNGELLIPNISYNQKNNALCDFAKMRKNICKCCFNENRQNQRG